MQQTFCGLLERDGTALRWIIVRIPFSPADVWPTRAGMRVVGTINDFPFRTSLFGSAERGYVLLVNKQMQKGAHATAGSLAEIALQPDPEERPSAAPTELARILKSDRSLRKWYEKLSPSIRKDIANTISEPKSAEARMRRAEQIAEQMLLTMEGEIDTPPILQIAFRRQPKALIGWQAMTPLQRRMNLLAIFHYQSPESRQKRADKAVEAALKVAVKQRQQKNAPSES